MTTPLPDFGPAYYRPDPENPAGFLANPAGILEMAASEDTPQTLRFRTAIVAAWARWKEKPLPEAHRQFGALAEALAAIDVSITLPGQMAPGGSKH